MKKEIKILGEFHWKLKDYFLTKLLLKKHKLKRVDKNPDIAITVVEPTPMTNIFLNSPKKVLVAGENLYYRVNLFKVLEYVSKKTRIKFDILNKVLPRKILNLPMGLIRKQYHDYVKNIAKKSPRGSYAVICNNIKGRNILNLPFFLQVNQIIERLGELWNPKKTTAKQKKKFCCIIISNESAFDRIDFYKKLSKYKKVDCYGRTSLTNSDNNLLPKSWADNPKFLSQYKFVISFENSFNEEYVTEKLANTMLANSVPIYKGAPNVSDYFNTDSFINYDDYGKSYDKMVEKIIEIDSDDKKYNKFLETEWLTTKNKQKINDKQKETEAFLNRVVEE
jgi:hypothetical protein